MECRPGLIQEKKLFLQKEVLYRQRFDACPHFMFFVGDAHGSDTNKSKYPFGQRITAARFSRNTADWYHIFSELAHTANEMMRRAAVDKRIIDEMIEEFLPWEEKFYGLCRKLGTTPLSKLSKKLLLALYRELVFVYTKKLNSSPLIDGFALTTDTLIAEKVRQFLIKKGKEERFVAYFETLTAPTFLSFLQEEEVAFLEKAQAIAKNPSREKKLWKQQQQEFFWIHNNYVSDNVLPVQFFEDKWKSYRALDLEKRRKEMIVSAQKNKEKKEQLMRELALPEEIRTLLYLTDRCNYWQDERKKGTFWATHYFSLLLEEVARRTSYILEELKYALPPEMEDILDEKIQKTELQRRFEDCFLVWVPDAFDLTTQTTEIETIITRKKEVLDTEVRGMSVSLGRAVGTVKVVESVRNISKVHKGDILVAVMTRPDYIPAMRKAAAFVTDEGGLTCHAAIVARELKVPCIVGTKTATSQLKDGMVVEVNANHGWVRRVESK